MLDAIKKRRSIRRYKDTLVEDQKIEEILKSGMVAPSAHHKYPWKIIIVKNFLNRQKLSEATPYCSFLKESPVVLVVLGEEENSSEWIEDASILSQNMVLEIVNQGLDSCYVQIRGAKTPEGNDAEDYVKGILEIPSKYRVNFMFPVGYRDEEKPSQAELKKEGKVYLEKFGNF